MARWRGSAPRRRAAIPREPLSWGALRSPPDPPLRAAPSAGGNWQRRLLELFEGMEGALPSLLILLGGDRSAEVSVEGQDVLLQVRRNRTEALPGQEQQKGRVGLVRQAVFARLDGGAEVEVDVLQGGRRSDLGQQGPIVLDGGGEALAQEALSLLRGELGDEHLQGPHLRQDPGQ